MCLHARLAFVLLTASHLFFNGQTIECSVIGRDRSTRKASAPFTRIPSLDKKETTKPDSTHSDEICGVPDIKPNTNSRIVGGVETLPNSWPWQVSLRYKECGWCHECGASLLYPYWVITAAHCAYELKPSNLRVLLGDHNQRKNETTEKLVLVSQVIIHERYNPSSTDNDIALLRLAFPVQFNRYIKPICLPTRDVDVHTLCIVTGWGDTNLAGFATRLNQVSVPILDRALCNSKSWYNGTITNNMICAGYAEGRKDACKLDSGGPLVCPTDGDRWTLDGITSWGEECAGRNNPGVYTRITNYLTWIRTKTRSDEICGVPDIKPNTNSRIVGGVEALPNSWPWQISLIYNESGWGHECGASLLYQYWVITAAHCAYKLKPSDVRVVLGEHNQRKNETTEKLVLVSQVIIHERFKPSSGDNDIALLRLASPVQYNRYIKPICLPTRDVDVHTLCIVTGWGNTELSGVATRLNQVSVPILDRRLCNSKSWYNGNITNNMICAGYAEGRKDACMGDSGGPLVCPTDDGRWTLDGITSWGYKCARRKTPGVYTRITNYLTWIRTKTRR